MVRLRYETGIATLIQFIIGSLLSFLNGAASIISSCHGNAASDCVSNALASLILILLTVFCLGALWAIGYFAQERRDNRLVIALIILESIAALLFLFNAKHSPSVLERISDVVAAGIALWIVVLAWRLLRAKGGRVVAARFRRHKV